MNPGDNAQSAWKQSRWQCCRIKRNSRNECHRFAKEASMIGTWPSTIADLIIVRLAQVAATGCNSLGWFLGVITFGNRWFFNAIAVRSPLPKQVLASRVARWARRERADSQADEAGRILRARG